MSIKTLVISGCTQGIGRALALNFAAKNCKVYAIGRNEKLLDNLAQESSNIIPIKADITHPKDQETIAQALQHEPHFSMIHNAGIFISSPFQDMSETLLRDHFETNFFAPLFLTQKFLKQLKGQRVLHISSGAAVAALADRLPYCTSKGALHHAIDCLKKEWGALEIYFSNLRPGMVDTPMQEKLRHEALASSDFYIQAQKAGKLIAPELVAAFVSWVMLETDNNTFTEQFWNIDDQEFRKAWLP